MEVGKMKCLAAAVLLVYRIRVIKGFTLAVKNRDAIVSLDIDIKKQMSTARVTRRACVRYIALIHACLISFQRSLVHHSLHSGAGIKKSLI